jgi:hypothetical protein
MIKKVTVFQKPDKSDAFTMVLTDPTNVTDKTGFAIDNIDGLGPVEADINTTEMVIDGDLFNSARVGKRNIVLELIFYSESGSGIESTRQYSYQLFPIKKQVYIEIEADNRTVWTYGYVEKNEPLIFSDMCKTQVSLICPDPKWYDSNGDVTTPIIPNTSTTIEYEGEVETGGYLTITIGSSVEAPVHAGVPAFTITCANPDGDAQLIDVFTPIGGFVEGDIITLTSVLGNKGCVWTDTADADHNALNLISQNPDWITFKSGLNTIRINDPNNAISEASFVNPVCYEGV